MSKNEFLFLCWVIIMVGALGVCFWKCAPRRKTPSEIAPPGYFDWLRNDWLPNKLHKKPDVLRMRVTEIAKLELQPGDILVVKTDVKQSAEAEMRIRKYMSFILPPDVKMMILPPGVSLEKVTPAPVDPAPVEGG